MEFMRGNDLLIKGNIIIIIMYFRTYHVVTSTYNLLYIPYYVFITITLLIT